MDRKLFKSILLIITYAVVLVMALARLDVVSGGLWRLLGLFKPLFIGFGIAFVLNRPCHFFCTSYLVLVIVISAIFSFVVPKLAQSIQIFVGSLSGYLNNLQTWTNELLAYLKLDTLDLSSLKAPLQNLFDQVLAFLSDLGPHLLEFTSGLVSMVVTGVLALVFSIYMLSGKERLLSQCRRLLRAYVPPKFADPILDVVHLTGDTFTHFVTGQLIEACILGGLCSIGMLFIQPDYAPLIGVIIGSSALIPVAGAYIGAILSVCRADQEARSRRRCTSRRSRV